MVLQQKEKNLEKMKDILVKHAKHIENSMKVAESGIKPESYSDNQVSPDMIRLLSLEKNQEPASPLLIEDQVSKPISNL